MELDRTQFYLGLAGVLSIPGVLPYWFDLVRLLLLDVYGWVLNWISWQDVVCFYVCDVVVWILGESCLSICGGINCGIGARSVFELYLIIAVRGYVRF